MEWDDIKFKMMKYYALVSPEESKLVFEVAKRLNAKTILEIGIGYGGFSLPLLYACQDTGGLLTSLTLATHFNNSLFETGSHPLFDELRQYWNPIIIRSEDFIKTWNSPIDLLVINSSHTYGDTIMELNVYSKFLVDNGEILLHDVFHSNGILDINRAVFEFISSNRNKVDWPKIQERNLESCWHLEYFNTYCGMLRMYKKLGENGLQFLV